MTYPLLPLRFCRALCDFKSLAILLQFEIAAIAILHRQFWTPTPNPQKFAKLGLRCHVSQKKKGQKAQNHPNLVHQLFLRKILTVQDHWEIKGGGGFGECALVPVFVLGEHANVHSFQFSFRGNIRMYPRSGFRSGGTSAKTSLLETHPFGNPRIYSHLSTWAFFFLKKMGEESEGNITRVVRNLAFARGKKMPFLGILFLFSGVWGKKRTEKKTALNPGTRVSLVEVLAKRSDIID